MRLSDRAKKLLGVLVVVLLIAEVIAAVLLFSIINGVQVPEATVRLKIVNVTSSAITLGAGIAVYNPNSFDVSLAGTSILVTNQDGSVILNLTVPDDSIPAQSNKTITTNKTVAFTGPLTDAFTATIHSTLGIKFFGIVNRQLPVTVHVVTSGADIISTMTVPDIRIDAKLGAMTPTGVPFSGTIVITNPDPLGFTLGNMTVSVFSGDQMLSEIMNISGSVVEPKKTTSIPFIGMLGIAIFNVQQLRFVFWASAEAMVAGLHKTLPITAEMFLPVPSLQVLLNSTVPLEISLMASFKLKPRGVLINITFMIENPYVIDLYNTDLVVSVLRMDQNVTHLLDLVALKPFFVSTNVTESEYGQTLIPYRTLLFSGSRHIIPTLFELDLDGNFSLAGINQSLPLSFNAILDPHFF
jgi:LEA14-like dessication related protein